MAGDVFLAGEKAARARFDDRAARLASVFRAAGVGEDDVVAILMRNDIAYLETTAACRRVGARFATLNWHAAKPEVEHVLADSGAKVLVAHASLAEPFADAPPDGVRVIVRTDPAAVAKAYGLQGPSRSGFDDFDAVIEGAEPCSAPPPRYRGIMAYTSGSTGRPKGIRRAHPTDGPDGYETYKALARMMLQMEAGDRFYTSAPLYHSAPNALSTMSIAAGDVDIHIAPKFDAEQFLADIERYRITHAYIVPTMMVRLLKLAEDVKRKYDTSSWRFSFTTGSPFPRDVKKAMIDWFGPIFWESYGASEIGFMTVISSEESMSKPGSVGKVLPGGSIKIFSDDGRELPPGEDGLIYIHLPMFGDFTYTNAEGDLKGQRRDGHASVGDIGRLDDDGYLYISDRKKDMIISGGANIFPAEIEAALLGSPEIADCAVFGAPHPEFGETIVAAVTAQPGATPTLESVRAFLEPRIARFKLPTKLDLHEALPREDSGKIFKQRLRAPYWENAGRTI